MKSLLTIAVLLFAAIAWSATTAPVIDQVLAGRFFKAQAQDVQAQMALQTAKDEATKKQTAFDAVVDELKKACGDKYEPQLNSNGDPVCVAKPEPAKAKP